MNKITLDLQGLKCPLPILRTKKALAGAPEDFAAFCKHTGHELLENNTEDGIFTLIIKHK